MSTRERLHELVDELTDEQAAPLEGYANQMLNDEEDVFTEEDIERILKAEAEMAAGEWVSWEDVKRKLGLDLDEPISVRERVHWLIDDLNDEQAAMLEDYAEQLLDEDGEEVFTEEQIDEILKIEAEMLAGHSVKWEDVKVRLGMDLTA